MIIACVCIRKKAVCNLASTESSITDDYCLNLYGMLSKGILKMQMLPGPVYHNLYVSRY